MELNTATPISKCVWSKLGILVVQRHCIWLLCPYEGLGCEVPMEYHDLSFRRVFFNEKNGGNKIKCSITKQWEGKTLNRVEMWKWKCESSGCTIVGSEAFINWLKNVGLLQDPTHPSFEVWGSHSDSLSDVISVCNK